MKLIYAFLLAVLLPSCSSMLVPGKGEAVAGAGEAMTVLKRSAEKTGNHWESYRKVTVGYDGEWTNVVKGIQPDLVDSDFRKASVETYDTRKETVEQTHKASGGTKTVKRTRGDVAVSYNGETLQGGSRRDASALVADAYTAFLFGPSWLAAKAKDLEVLQEKTVEGEVCDGVQGALRPGFGFSDEDRFVAWIGRDTGLMKRLQFTIEGLESTAGSDVEVTFSEHWTAADGSVWPGRFVEWVQRPILVKAHDWRMTSLRADGRRLK